MNILETTDTTNMTIKDRVENIEILQRSFSSYFKDIRWFFDEDTEAIISEYQYVQYLETKQSIDMCKRIIDTIILQSKGIPISVYYVIKGRNRLARTNVRITENELEKFSANKIDLEKVKEFEETFEKQRRHIPNSNFKPPSVKNAIKRKEYRTELQIKFLDKIIDKNKLVYSSTNKMVDKYVVNAIIERERIGIDYDGILDKDRVCILFYTHYDPCATTYLHFANHDNSFKDFLEALIT